jgi:phospholipid transport system substrate-binding protein
MRFTHTLVAVGFLAISAPLAADQAQAKQLIESFHDGLVQVMQTPDHAQRETYLEPHIANVFDTSRIAAISLGRAWRSLPDAEQIAFIELLAELIVATYADRFDGYSGQHFVTDEVQAVRTGFVVRTRLRRDAAADVALDYFLRDDKVFNVVADGVSDLSLRRADYNSIIKSEGYERLLEHIRDKISAARRGT